MSTLRFLVLCLTAVAQPALGGATLHLEQSPVVLGQTESVSVTLNVEEAEDAADRPLRLAVNVGTFADVKRVSRGVYKTVYVPPSTRFPQVALVAVWRETGPTAPIDFLRIPLYGTTKVPVSARRGATVSALMSGEPTPPVLVGKSRRVDLPLTVPPAVDRAVLVIAEPRAPVLKREVPIRVPPYNRLTAGLVPHAIAADGNSEARLDVFYDLGGIDVPASRLRVAASVGQVSFVRANRGRYVYRYLAPVGTDARSVTFAVTVDGDPTAHATAAIDVGLPPVARLVLRPPPPGLASGGTGTFDVLAFDERGLGLKADDLLVTANDEPAANIRYAGEGLHKVTIRASAAYPPGGLLRLSVRLGAGGGLSTAANYQLKPPPTPGQVHARFEPGLVPADGRTVSRLVLDVRDGAGLPLTGTNLIAIASHGAASPVSETEGGRYEVTYVGPKEIPEGEALVKLVDTAGNFEKSVVVPLREDAGRLLLGVRGGMNHDLGRFSSPRVGVDLWTSFQLGSSTFGVGVVGTVAQASQQFGEGPLANRSEALFVPVSLRLGYELAATRRMSLVLGAGPTATWARLRSSLSGIERQRWGYGGQAFLSAAWVAGPGHLFTELSYTYSPIEAPDFSLDAGGAGVAVGYRFRLF